MNTELIKLSAACGRDIYDMLQSIPADENGLMNDAHGLSYDEYKAWLEKRYAGKQALCGVDLQMEPGQIIGLLGPNTAG